MSQYTKIEYLSCKYYKWIVYLIFKIHYKYVGKWLLFNYSIYPKKDRLLIRLKWDSFDHTLKLANDGRIESFNVYLSVSVIERIKLWLLYLIARKLDYGKYSELINEPLLLNEEKINIENV